MAILQPVFSKGVILFTNPDTGVIWFIGRNRFPSKLKDVVKGDVILIRHDGWAWTVERVMQEIVRLTRQSIKEPGRKENFFVSIESDLQIFIYNNQKQST